MGYKILGFAVWQGVKWYLRHNVDRKTAALGAGGLVFAGLAVGGIIAAQRDGSGN